MITSTGTIWLGEQHLDALALATRLVKGRRVVEGPGDIAGILMDIARNLAVWGLGAASLFERTGLAVALAGPVEQRAAVSRAGAACIPIIAPSSSRNPKKTESRLHAPFEAD